MRSCRSPRPRILRLATLFTAAALAFMASPAVQAQGSADPGTSKALVNVARSSAGRSALGGSSGLDSLARAHAQRMADRDAIYHNPNLQQDADAAGVPWTLIGENVGVGADVETIHEAFMASTGHRSNIVHPDYTVVGVGTARGKDGSVFVAQVFARVASSAPEPAPAAPASAAPAAARVAQPVVAPTVAVAETASDTIEVPAAEPVDPSDPNALLGGIVNE